MRLIRHVTSAISASAFLSLGAYLSDGLLFNWFSRDSLHRQVFDWAVAVALLHAAVIHLLYARARRQARRSDTTPIADASATASASPRRHDTRYEILQAAREGAAAGVREAALRPHAEHPAYLDVLEKLKENSGGAAGLVEHLIEAVRLATGLQNGNDAARSDLHLAVHGAPVEAVDASTPPPAPEPAPPPAAPAETPPAQPETPPPEAA